MALAAYVLGSVPAAYIVVRAVNGEDIRDVGSHNVGALNAYRRVGEWAGLTVLLVDAAKGVLAVTVPRLFGIDDWALFITTPLVVAGHNWPVFLNFRGGKGAATIFGISLVVVPWLTVITAGPSILVMLLLRNVVLGAAFGFILLKRAALDHRPRCGTGWSMPSADAVGHRHLRSECPGPNPKQHQGPAVASPIPRTSWLEPLGPFGRAVTSGGHSSSFLGRRSAA